MIVLINFIVFILAAENNLGFDNIENDILNISKEETKRRSYQGNPQIEQVLPLENKELWNELIRLESSEKNHTISSVVDIKSLDFGMIDDNENISRSSCQNENNLERSSFVQESSRSSREFLLTNEINKICDIDNRKLKTATLIEDKDSKHTFENEPIMNDIITLNCCALVVLKNICKMFSIDSSFMVTSESIEEYYNANLYNLGNLMWEFTAIAFPYTDSMKKICEKIDCFNVNDIVNENSVEIIIHEIKKCAQNVIKTSFQDIYSLFIREIRTTELEIDELGSCIMVLFIDSDVKKVKSFASNTRFRKKNFVLKIIVFLRFANKLKCSSIRNNVLEKLLLEYLFEVKDREKISSLLTKWKDKLKNTKIKRTMIFILAIILKENDNYNKMVICTLFNEYAMKDEYVILRKNCEIFDTIFMTLFNNINLTN